MCVCVCLSREEELLYTLKVVVVVVVVVYMYVWYRRLCDGNEGLLNRLRPTRERERETVPKKGRHHFIMDR